MASVEQIAAAIGALLEPSTETGLERVSRETGYLLSSESIEAQPLAAGNGTITLQKTIYRTLEGDVIDCVVKIKCSLNEREASAFECRLEESDCRALQQALWELYLHSKKLSNDILETRTLLFKTRHGLRLEAAIAADSDRTKRCQVTVQIAGLITINPAHADMLETMSRALGDYRWPVVGS